jgi:hypothetical protein
VTCHEDPLRPLPALWHPAGLPTPSPSQYHGTVMLAGLVGVIMLVLLLLLSGR